jgi:outer membrane protein OmpA-like peptidoglycan-associated protein
MRYEFTFRPEPFPWSPESEWEGEANRSSPDYIRWLQSSLNRVMGLRLAVDGIVGPATRSAVRSFQQRKGLAVDGIVGANTEAALIAAGAPKPPVAVSASAAGSPSSAALPPECSAAASANCDVLEDFALDDDTLTAIHWEQIAGIARRVISSQEAFTPITPITSLTIVGHASPDGRVDYNIDLAFRRAMAVGFALDKRMEDIKPGSSSLNRVDVDVQSCGEKKIPGVSNPVKQRRVDVCFRLERVLWGSARSYYLREERINELIEEAMSSDSRTVLVAGGPVNGTTGAFSYSLPASAPVRTAFAASAASLAFTVDGGTPTGKYTLVGKAGATVKTLEFDVSVVDFVAPTWTFP